MRVRFSDDFYCFSSHRCRKRCRGLGTPRLVAHVVTPLDCHFALRIQLAVVSKPSFQGLLEPDRSFPNILLLFSFHSGELEVHLRARMRRQTVHPTAEDE